MTDYRRTLLTGAGGALGTQLRRSGTRLGKIVRLSARERCTDLAPHEEDVPADLTDLDAVSRAVEGCEAIVHMGGQGLEGPWKTVLDDNIVGGYNIYEAARRHGVKRIVYASSVHAVGFHKRTETIDGNAPTRPDSLYGVSKTFVENLARYYFDKFGIETVALRIGSSFPEPTDRRHLITWLSYRDCRQLVEKSLSAPRVGFMIAYGTSNNAESFWDNRTAAVLGYEPEDSADDFREQIVANTAQGDPNDPAVRFQGGSFCAAGHFDDPPTEDGQSLARPSGRLDASPPQDSSMPRTDEPRNGGQILVDALRIHGVERVFCVPGESYLAALDALHDASDEIELIVCRQEGGAAYMAEACGKMTGNPGICLVTRGPGATNASIGVHTAFQDSSPMILFVGQVARDQVEREAFQEIDYRRMFGQMAKWVVQIDEAARLPELLSQAFHRAVNGRPGPVVVALPEDMLTDRVCVNDAPAFARVPMFPGAPQLAELRGLLDEAERPLVVAGGGGWTPDAVASLHAFSERFVLPVAASFRCQDLFDNTHENYAGDLGLAAGPKLARRVADSDLLIVVGARLGEMTTGGYSLIDIPLPKQTLVHIHTGAEELGRVYRPTLGINADPESFCAEAASLAPLDAPPWTSWTSDAHADYLANLEHSSVPGAVQMGEVMRWLRGHLPADAILTTGAGNYSAWVHRFYQYRAFRTQLGPTNGSMGYGTPAAIAAKLTAPGRTVVAFAGDGCFLMNGQEIATAVQHDARIIVLVINNGMYGTIRMHQERTYPGRVSGTNLVNPDFAALARAYGLHGEIVERTDEFAAAFERCESSGKPALIEIRIDPEALTPTLTLSRIRERALARR